MIDKILLFPYYAALKLRDRAYRKGAAKSVRADVPTICIGNITVGGTGKTPHTEMILRELLGDSPWNGKQIAVLSGGYKRKSRGFHPVSADGSAAMFGDEPLQIKKKFPGAVVAVHRDRVEGCRFLSDPALQCPDSTMPPADLIVLDDAFQYRKLQYTVSIVLVDYNRPLHKDHLLPLGRLRDLPERIGEADIIIVTKCPYELEDPQKTAWAGTLGIKDFSLGSCEGTSFSGKRQKVFFTRIEHEMPKPVYDCSDSRYTYSRKIILFTGIAKDRPLRNFLSDRYQIVRHFSFPDHHRFVRKDFRKIRKAVDRCPTALVVTTEKDAQRVLDFKDIPLALRERMHMIPIRVEFLSENERRIFRDTLFGFLKKA